MSKIARDRLTVVVCVICYLIILLRSIIASTVQAPHKPEITHIAVVDVTSGPYFADSTGKSDTTKAIRSAIDASCSHGGGQVYFPEGTYKVSIQLPYEIAAVPIGCDNLTIEGASKDKTVISSYAFGDDNPDTACPVINTRRGELTPSTFRRNMWEPSGMVPTVNRGSAFWVYGKRSHITFRNIRITGNRRMYSDMNSNGSEWPATQSNCFNVWDITNKGIYFQPDIPHDHCLLDHIRIDHWSGELFYFGYGDTRRPGGLITVVDSEFDHGTSDGLSVASQLIAARNNFHDLGAQAIENASYAERQIIQHNTIYNCAQGITVANFPVAQRGGSFEIGYNLLRNISKTAVMIAAQNVRVHDSKIVDFAYRTDGLYAGIGIVNDTKGYCPSRPRICGAKNVEIDHNLLFADRENSGRAILAVGGDYLSADNVSIHENRAAVTPFAVAHSVSILESISISGNISHLLEYSNTATGTKYRGTEQSAASNLAVGSVATTVVRLRPVRLREFTVRSSITVLSPTKVTGTLSWFDAKGIEQFYAVFANHIYTAGVHVSLPFDLVAQGANESQVVKLVLTTDRPGSVKASAAIEEKGK